ncbi:exonuclease domain-containing protein [Pararhodospirillum photometricum]|nr:exonuclease domain-containing protein [Pararhodospirillum photometricum]
MAGGPEPWDAEREAWELARTEAALEALRLGEGERRPGLFDGLAHRTEPWWRHVFGLSLRRSWLGWRSPPGPLRTYYRTPIGDGDLPWTAVEYLALDIEATGLDADTDEILSIGYVPIVEGRIRLAGAGYHLVRPRRPVPEETAVLHGILDGHLETAPRLGSVMPLVLRALAGRVVVAHHARLERFFLSRACRRLYGQPLELSFVDTLELEYQALIRAGHPVERGALRLAAARARRGLPRYKAHNALTDAVAAAELLLAQAEGLSDDAPVRVRALLG